MTSSPVDEQVHPSDVPAHVMDTHPHRFGWRVWHLNPHDGTLISPIHKGPLRGGRRFFEMDCPHTSSRRHLARDCGCGIYYVPMAGRSTFLREFVSYDVQAVTFGVALGEVADDPVIPGKALRVPRYAVLNVMLPVTTPFEQRVRVHRRYGVPVLTWGFGADAFRNVQQMAQTELLSTDPSEFFDSLWAEPFEPLSAHICDIHYEQFGWRTWFVEESGELHNRNYDVVGASVVRWTSPIEADTADAVPPLAKHGPRVSLLAPHGVSFTPSARYALMILNGWAGWKAANPQCQKLVATTFGVTAGHSAPIGRDDPDYCALARRRTSAYYPLAVCVPEGHPGLGTAVARRYGLPVADTQRMVELLRMEREVRSRLDSAGSIHAAIAAGQRG